MKDNGLMVEDKPSKAVLEEKRKAEQLLKLLNRLEYQEAKQVQDLDWDKMGALPLSPLTWLKYKLFRAKGWAWILKCSANGGVKLLFVKNPKQVSFGKKTGDFGKRTSIKDIRHWLAGNPLHIVVEGMPVNVSLNKEIKVSDLAPHIDATITYAHHIGVIRGMKQKISGVFSNPFILILLIIVVIAAFAGMYFSLQAYQAMQGMQATLNAVLAAGG